MNLYTVLALGSITIVLSYFGVLEYSKWAISANVLDIPNERSSHTEPIPRGGGIVIVVLTFGGIFIYQVLGCCSSWKVIYGFMLGAFMISGISWVDDLYSLSIGIRFTVHGLAAIIGIASFGYWQTISFPLIGQIHLGLVGLPLTFMWIVGLTNAFNFMDGIDGIAAAQATVAGFWWAGFWVALSPTAVVGPGVIVGLQQPGIFSPQLAAGPNFYGGCGQCLPGLYFRHIAAHGQ